MKKALAFGLRRRYNIGWITMERDGFFPFGKDLLPMKNGFVKIASVSPSVSLADPIANAGMHGAWAKRAAEEGVKLLCFPALSLSGSTAGDLFFSHTLIDGCKKGLELFLEETREAEMLALVGLPIEVDGALYQCTAVCLRGKVLGFVCQRGNLRYFAAPPKEIKNVMWQGYSVPLGNGLLFECLTLPHLIVGVADRMSAQGGLSRQGATLVCLPAATPELVGSSEARLEKAKVLSKSAACALLLSECGMGESTTDLVFAGQGIIAENGKILAERPPFHEDDGLLISEIDIQLLAGERRRKQKAGKASVTRIAFSLPLSHTPLTRFVDPHPFMPVSADEKAVRCDRILEIQARGLSTRLTRAWAKKAVLGISGGLDSTLALLVMIRAMDALKRPHSDILTVTMPCFGTTARTKNNATVLCEELGTDFRCVDIFDAVNQHFADIGHDPSVHDVTYENSQARERTQILMDIANREGGMVIGTGDLSELALGWATYNGDHMSMYSVNGSVPKTLVRHLVAHEADRFAKEGKKALSDALYDILDTPVSPELLPAREGGEIAQKTEDLVGPYELHDFYLYHTVRYGFSPEKLYRLATAAFDGAYDDETLKKWLTVFLRRFFNQQFKRSCMPDGPKVGRVSLSPRGDWCMPSDALSALWLKEAEALSESE